MEVIPELDTLIAPVLDGAKIVSCRTQSLIAPGENYGSTMCAVDLVLDDARELHLVAKMCPTSDYMKRLFNVKVTVKKEVSFYEIIVPALQDFQRRNHCEVFASFARCYGARYSLDPAGTEVDDGCCLLLENVKWSGYGIEDRMVGFNVDCARFLLRELATFHALPIAYKLHEPAAFEALVFENIHAASINRTALPEEDAEKLILEILARVEGLERYRPHLATIGRMMRRSVRRHYEPHTDVVEPYASLVHSDFWTNNTMIRKDAAGKCVANCIVDFQLLNYGNPFADLMFFLYTSVQLPVLRERHQEFVDLYHDTFIQVLKDHKVDDLERFSKQLCLKEIDRCMKRYEMYHCLFMLTPIFARKEKATEFSQLDMASINDRSKMDSEKYYARLEYLLDDFVLRGWLELK